jgi:hypothetical protein
MAKIYQNQTSLRIQATVGVDITGGTAVIRARAPGSTYVEWPGTTSSSTGGVFYYDLTSTGNELGTASGDWRMWGFVTFADGRTAPGLAEIVEVSTEGS